MQQFKRYDVLKNKTGKIAKTIAKKHNFIRMVYICAILIGSILGMHFAIIALPPGVSHLFFSAFCSLYITAILLLD